MKKLFLLFTAGLLAGCSSSGPAAEKPELPKSVAPGWTQTGYSETPAPAALPATATPPKCWLAIYGGPGTAEVRLCGYATPGPAFDAGQRYPTAANTVKFQIENWFVLVNWKDSSQTDITALVRSLQRTLEKKK
jgi:hypothetical protein